MNATPTPLPARAVMLLLAMFFSCLSYAQKKVPWEEYIEQIAEDEDIDDGQLEQLYDDLSELAENKIDINTCSREDLERLPFLSSQQVMDIMEYRYKARRIETPLELFFCPSLDRQTLRLMNYFVTYSPAPKDTIPSLRKVFKYGRNEVLADFNMPFYEREGDRNGYLGYKYKHWLRYRFSYGSRIKAGITASQDAGEPFFAGKNSKGYDFYSPYILLRDMRRLKALAIGRYRLRLGLGLAMNTGFGFGKIATLTGMRTMQNKVFAHTSRSEGTYLQGAAATVNLFKGFDITPFVSYRKIDATLSKDSSAVTNIITNGLHRTQSEMARRGNTSETIIGGNVNYFNNGFHVGLTGFHVSFDRTLKMNSGGTYRRWYPCGSGFWNASVDYGYIKNRLSISGETATSDQKKIATINTVSYRFKHDFFLIALQRFYPYQYYSFRSETFSEGGQANDESGLFVGGKWIPLAYTTLTFYTDISYFAWPKYGVSKATHRWDNFVQMDYATDNWTILARYRIKLKEIDNEDKSGLLNQYNHRARLSAGYGNDTWNLKTQADISYIRDKGNSFGFMLSENAAWTWRCIYARALFGYFHTDDYQSRVYCYEPGLYSSFYYPSFFGHGIRAALNIRATVNEDLILVAKFGSTHYFDRNSISSGLQQINSSTKTDLEMQVKWKF